MKLHELKPGMRVRSVGTWLNPPHDYIVLSTLRVAKVHDRPGTRAVFTLDGKTYALPGWYHVPSQGLGSLIPVCDVETLKATALPLRQLSFEVTEERLERERAVQERDRLREEEEQREREFRAASFPGVKRELARALGDAAPPFSGPDEKRLFTAEHLLYLISIATYNNSSSKEN